MIFLIKKIKDKTFGTVIKSDATLNSQAKMWHTFEYKQTFVGVPHLFSPTKYYSRKSFEKLLK